MNTEELLKNFQSMIEAYQKEHVVAVIGNASVDMKKLITKAKNAKFVKHILCSAEPSIRDLYCTGLFSLFQTEKNAENRSNAMTFVGRIIASYSDDVDLDGYLVRSAKIDSKFWSDFFEFVKGDIAFNFAVDALLMYYLSGKADAMLKGILDIVEVFGADKERLFGLVKAILEQGVDGIVKFGGENFLGYAKNKRLAWAKLLKSGDKTVTFGRWYKVEYKRDVLCYRVEREYSDSSKPIEWFVIGVRDDKALLLSRFGVEFRSVECSPERRGEWNWENCKLKKWLNNDFLCNAFTTEENKHFGVKLNSDEDVVFLLSCGEVREYLTSRCKLLCDRDIFGDNMENAVGKREALDKGVEKEGWWLRDSSEGEFFCVFGDGKIGKIHNNMLLGFRCWKEFGLVRPAMWVKIDSELFDL